MVYKINTLVVYPGTFGGFKNLTALLPGFKQMGINQIHVLPFYEATGDDGFEVVNYSLTRPLRVAQQWGGLKAFKTLVQAAANNGMTLMADAVLNHISSRSPVLKQAGLAKLCLSWPQGQLPFKFLRWERGQAGGVDAVYWHHGREVRQMVIFPEQADPNQPHLVESGNRWVWHTFYPHQFDLDLNQPEAFALAEKTLWQIAGWLGGAGTIRLDAILFVGKVINKDKFEFVDSVNGRKIVAKLHRVLKAKAPQISLIAEAALPLSKQKSYLDLVGGNYDFLNFPRFVAAVATENPSGLISSVNTMIKTLGLAAVGQLAFTLQTHDDIPLAELGDGKLSREVWLKLKQSGALPFGVSVKGGLPKGAVIRLGDLCAGKPDKLAAAFFLAALMPHGRLLWLYGTEVGLPTGAVLPPELGLQPDNRTAVRQPLKFSQYRKLLSGSLAKKIGAILKWRLEQLPDRYDRWEAKAKGGKVTINFSGTKNSKKISGIARVNLTEPYDYNLGN